MKRAILVLLVVAAIALFIGMGLDQYLTLDALKESQGKFAVMLEQSPRRVTLISFVLYVFVVALSLPGVTIMGLAMGALYGFWYGTLLVFFASTIGATLAFMISHYLLRDFVQYHFGDKLKGINADTQLARIESLSDIFSPGVLLSFALLGVFPLIAKKNCPSDSKVT